MAVRIHYRHGLLHSSEDKQKRFLGLSFKIRPTVEHTNWTGHSTHKWWTQLLISLSHLVNDQMRLQAFPYGVQKFSKMFLWQRSILLLDNGFKLVQTSVTNLQTCDSRHAPDAYGIFDNKNIPSSSFKNADRKEYCVSRQHFLSFNKQSKISAAIKSC